MPIAQFEEAREIAAGSITGTFAVVGAATTHRVRAFLVSNATAGDMWFSLDNSKNHFPVLAGSFVLFDVASLMKAQGEDEYFLPIGTSFSIKSITAPVSKSVYISVLH